MAKAAAAEASSFLLSSSIGFASVSGVSYSALVNSIGVVL